jgi:hypothetical protein
MHLFDTGWGNPISKKVLLFFIHPRTWALLSGLLMHVNASMNFATLIYLIVHWGPRYVFIDSGEFLNNLIYFYLTLQNTVIYIFEFQRSSDRQTDLIFLPHHLKKTKIFERSCQRGRHKARYSTYHTVHKLDRMVLPISRLMCPFLDIFTSTNRLKLKSTICPFSDTPLD